MAVAFGKIVLTKDDVPGAIMDKATPLVQTF